MSCAESTGSDSVILLMAIHTALTIFASRKANIQNGLYLYRWGGYACWAVYSVLMAALAFINPSNPYVFQGTFCYLPARPIWYRLALSWIPRYLILCTILGIYLAVYLYTRSKFGAFDARFSTESFISGDSTQHSGTDPPPSWPVSDLDGADDPRDEGPNTLMTSPTLGSNSFQPLLRPPSRLVNRTPTLLESTLIASAERRAKVNAANAALRQQHRDIKRQLRYMFVYPLVYLAMWIPAFVNHCYLCQ